MGDALELPQDKRHRSSSSLAPTALDDTRSERKLNRGSIPEVNDQFSIAEGRCDDLQQKIDIIKSLRRKKKMKRRTTLTPTIEQPPPAMNPFIFVKTQPKKKLSQLATRLRRAEAPNPARSCLDPATVEQHRMVGQYNKHATQLDTHQHVFHEHVKIPKKIAKRARADGDNVTDPHLLHPDDYIRPDDMRSYRMSPGYDISQEYSTDEEPAVGSKPELIKKKPPSPVIYSARKKTSATQYKAKDEKLQHPAQPPLQLQQSKFTDRRVPSAQKSKKMERPLVELFSKNRQVDTRARLIGEQRDQREPQGLAGTLSSPVTIKSKVTEKAQRAKHITSRKRFRRYELPTVSSQMKQAGTRHYYENANYSKIPFVSSNSVTPSHNIGVNIQQVLNSLKVQQPLSGIPLTIAYHMGLGHIPQKLNHEKSRMQPILSNGEINFIKAGNQLFRLPSFKGVSFKKLLSFYKEGDGMVPKFLRAIDRPQFFYAASMHNLEINRDDVDGATSKGRGSLSPEARQIVEEYTILYREYERLEKCLKEKYEPELEKRKDDVAKEMTALGEHLRKVVYELGSAGDVMEQSMPLRASASIAEDGYRYSSYKLKGSDYPRRPREQRID